MTQEELQEFKDSLGKLWAAFQDKHRDYDIAFYTEISTYRGPSTNKKGYEIKVTAIHKLQS